MTGLLLFPSSKSCFGSASWARFCSLQPVIPLTGNLFPHRCTSTYEKVLSQMVVNNCLPRRLLPPPPPCPLCTLSCPLAFKIWGQRTSSPEALFKFIYFNWKIITLQYCDGFCHTSTWISHRYTCVPPILNPTPTSLPTLSLWVVPEHWLWVPSLPCFKLVFEKAEEPEIKLPTSAGSWKKLESSRKTSISALLTMPKPLCGSQ